MHAFFFKMSLQGFAGVELLVPVLVLSLAVPVVLLLLVVLDTVVVVLELVLVREVASRLHWNRNAPSM